MDEMEIPCFTGKYPYSWIYKVERYCIINNIPDDERLSVAIHGLEGRALDWLYEWGSRTEKFSWDNFCEELLQQFRLRKETSGEFERETLLRKRDDEREEEKSTLDRAYEKEKNVHGYEISREKKMEILPRVSKIENPKIQEVIEKQVLTVVQAVANKIDEEIVSVDRLDDNDREALREQRLHLVQKMENDVADKKLEKRDMDLGRVNGYISLRPRPDPNRPTLITQMIGPGDPHLLRNFNERLKHGRIRRMAVGPRTGPPATGGGWAARVRGTAGRDGETNRCKHMRNTKEFQALGDPPPPQPKPPDSSPQAATDGSFAAEPQLLISQPAELWLQLHESNMVFIVTQHRGEIFVGTHHKMAFERRNIASERSEPQVAWRWVKRQGVNLRVKHFNKGRVSELGLSSIYTGDPLYIRKLLFINLDESSIECVLRQLRKLPWNEREPHLWKFLMKAHKQKCGQFHLIASLSTGLSHHVEVISAATVDEDLEKIKLGLEFNSCEMHGRRMACKRLLGELNNYKQGVLDPLGNCFLIRLVITLIRTSGHYFDHGSFKRKLAPFLIHCQRYISSNDTLLLDIELDLQGQKLIQSSMLREQTLLAFQIFFAVIVYFANTSLVSCLGRLPSMDGKVALIPWAYMLHLGCDMETFLEYDKLSKGIVFSTDLPYQPGEQMFISYETKSNWEFLLSYGNRVELSLSLTDGSYREKLEILKKFGLSVSQCFPIQLTVWQRGLMAYAYLVVSPSSMRGQSEEMFAAAMLNSAITIHVAVSGAKEVSLCFKQWDPGGRILQQLQDPYLNLHLADKVNLLGGSIVRHPPMTRVHARKMGRGSR